MDPFDPHGAWWPLQSRRERQETTEFEAYALGTAPPGGPLPGAGGVTFRSGDIGGDRELSFDVRPVVLGQVEVRVRLATRSADKARPHAKTLYIPVAPEGLRDLARQLMDAANAADRLKPKPRPVR